MIHVSKKEKQKNFHLKFVISFAKQGYMFVNLLGQWSACTLLERKKSINNLIRGNGEVSYFKLRAKTFIKTPSLLRGVCIINADSYHAH